MWYGIGVSCPLCGRREFSSTWVFTARASTDNLPNLDHDADDLAHKVHCDDLSDGSDSSCEFGVDTGASGPEAGQLRSESTGGNTKMTTMTMLVWVNRV